MEFEEISEKDIQEYLSSIGINPCRENGRSYVYYSPFRAESEPSFYVWKKNNRWKDFGNDKWGNILDLVRELYGVGLMRAASILTKGEGVDLPKFEKPTKPPKKGIDIVSVNIIAHEDMIAYLRSRYIEPDLARLFCKQIEFRFPEFN